VPDSAPAVASARRVFKRMIQHLVGSFLIGLGAELIFLIAAAILIVLRTFGSGADSPSASPLDEFLAVFALPLQFVIVPCVVWLFRRVIHAPFRVGQRLLARPASVYDNSGASPVLLLRSFSDDSREVVTMSPFLRAIFFAYFPWHYTTFEDLLVRIFGRVGPVVAVGCPGDMIPPTGAARLWIDGDQWQARVAELISRARLIVMIIGRLDRHAGLKWELHTLLERRSVPLCFLLPPLNEDECRRRWNLLADATNGLIPEYSGAELGAILNPDGTVAVVSSDRSLRRERDYLRGFGSMRQAIVWTPRFTLWQTLANTLFASDSHDLMGLILFNCWMVFLIVAITFSAINVAIIYGPLGCLLWCMISSIALGWLISLHGDLRRKTYGRFAG
jgi:hypothetical protein